MSEISSWPLANFQLFVPIVLPKLTRGGTLCPSFFFFFFFFQYIRTCRLEHEAFFLTLVEISCREKVE